MRLVSRFGKDKAERAQVSRRGMYTWHVVAGAGIVAGTGNGQRLGCVTIFTSIAPHLDDWAESRPLGLKTDIGSTRQ